MNILYLITGLGLGGAEKVVIDLADQMNALGHNVKIAYLTGEMLLRPASIEIEIISLDMNSKNDLFSASKKYKQLVRYFKPNVVHAHMIHANVFARLNRIGCALPKLICTAHNSNEGGKLRMLAYRATNCLSDINSNVSQEATAALINKGAFSKSNLITVYNGINLSKFQKESDNIQFKKKTVNLIAIGRFSDQKDYPNLINAFAVLKSQNNSNVKLNIVGDGELRSEIEILIKELQLEEDITLLGRRSDIPQLLSQAAIFVLASKFEGFGLVVAAAMACESYVVATDSGGVAEVMGNTGKLVPIQNSQALADALQNAMALSSKDRMQNNRKARARVEQLFSLETSVQKWLALYEA